MGSTSDETGFQSQQNSEGFNVKWIHGSPNYGNRSDPPIQVHWYNPHTVIMRQSKDISFEAPFIYLLFGKEKALLLDTGAVSDPRVSPIRKLVDELIGKWQGDKGTSGYELIIAHTHGHNDHTSGDGQFEGRPDTTVIGKDVESVKGFFGLAAWPDGTGKLDLGGRVLDVIPSPGHDEREISLYDPLTGLLFTGDSIYPGRLYISDFPAFLSTLDRIQVLSRERKITCLVGSHIERASGPGKDNRATSRYQPHEPPLQMTMEQFAELKAAAQEVSGRKGAHTFDDFLIFNGPCYGALMKQLLRAALYNFRHRHKKGMKMGTDVEKN